MTEKKQGTVEVAGATFSWWVTEGDPAVLTVSHPEFGSKSETHCLNPEILAELLAKELMDERLREV